MQRKNYNREVTLGPQFFIDLIENVDKNEKGYLKEYAEDIWGVDKSWQNKGRHERSGGRFKTLSTT